MLRILDNLLEKFMVIFLGRLFKMDYFEDPMREVERENEREENLRLEIEQQANE